MPQHDPLDPFDPLDPLDSTGAAPSPGPGDVASLGLNPPPSLVDEIAERLRVPCAHLSPEQFAGLVLQIARTKQRFARRAASLPGLSGLWDPPGELGAGDPPLATPNE